MAASDAEGREAPSVQVPGGSPVTHISSEQVRVLGQKLREMFQQFRADRFVVEQRWLRAQRQYLGVYDPDVERKIAAGRSMAYPRITRTKVISTVARLMNLMFPGDERNWTLDPSPSPDMSAQDVQAAVEDYIGQTGVEGPPTPDVIADAIRMRARRDADALMTVIDDQLEELGGDQTQDFISLNRRVVRSGAIYGVGLLRGPFARETTHRSWELAPPAPAPTPDAVPSLAAQFGVAPPADDAAPSTSPYQLRTSAVFKPVFEFLPVWDFYPDMAAKTLREGAGYFVRTVMSRSQLLDLARRPDFYPDVIRDFVRANTGNYTAQGFETELRTMGVRVAAKEQKTNAERYEVLTWHGALSAQTLADCGVQVASDRMGTEVEAEVWFVENKVIKVDLNPWAKLGMKVPSLHVFLFDDDDTSPLGQGLCDILRDTQMSACNVARMMLDNASVVCGPMVEVNDELLAPGQNVSTLEAYKIFVRDNNQDPQNAQYPAVREIRVDSHIKELQALLQMLMQWADSETFVSPQTGGDASIPSEPMRTMGGASMMRSEAALPFKDVVRAYDVLTASIIGSLVAFNRAFNPSLAPAGDYNVIPRGATSLIAKELRALQIDQLAATLTPDDAIYIDRQKLMKARFAARDLLDMMKPDALVAKALEDQARQAAAMQQQQQQMMEAQLREVLAQTFKNMQQGVKNAAAADAQNASAGLDILERSGMFAQAGSPQESGNGAQNDGGDQGRANEAGQADDGMARGASGDVRPTPALDQMLGGQVQPGAGGFV